MDESYDEPGVELAIRQLLKSVGEDPDRDGLRETPARVARSYRELLGGLAVDPMDPLKTTFEVDTDDLVMVKSIDFHSLCEHHLLPFFGTVDLAYLPSGGRVTGLSKLARCVDGYARRPQIQERLTKQVGLALEKALGVRGAAVRITAEHMCMTMRGVRKQGAKTVTTYFSGELDTHSGRQEVLTLFDSGR